MGAGNEYGTLRRRLTSLIHRQQPYYSLFAEHPEAIFRVSREGQLMEVNARACELAGLSEKALLGLSWNHLVAENDRDLAAECLQQSLQGTSCRFHCELRLPHGTAFLASVTQVPVTGMKAGVFSIVRDRSHSASRDLRLHQSREELRRLNRFQDTVRENEQRRIARDLHDQMGQTLTALKLDLGLLIEDLPSLSELHLRRLEALLDFVDETIEQVREIAANLRPAMLDELGFEAAAEWFLQRCGRHGLQVQWSVQGEAAGHPGSEVATALFRVLQEAMTNIIRHARATEVKVHYREDDRNALLSVQDNGVGFDVSNQTATGMGLLGMRERVAMLGGTLTIDSIRQQGTTVQVSLPLGACTQND